VPVAAVVDDARNDRLLDTEPPCDFVLSDVAGGVGIADPTDRLLGEWSVAVAALPHLVGRVVGMCASREMRSLDARRVVAAMQNDESWRNRAVRNRIGEAVGRH